VVENIVAGLITTAMLAAGGLFWRYRHHLGLLRSAVRPANKLRVSVAALLRIKDDDGYVLFHHPFRPYAYGPPGGVVKYTGGARQALDAVGFVEQRSPGRESTMAHDLRGFVPARNGIAFLRWYASGADRESAAQCLLRELREELAEVGHPDLAALTDDLRFSLVRSVSEAPRPTPGKPYRTLRQFEVYDVIVDSPQAAELVRRLVALGRQPQDKEILLASITDIEEGRCGQYLISPQSAFLFGDRRIHDDVPALR
jgi:hypothetical protein